MGDVDLATGLTPASVPPLPIDAAQIGAGDWDVTGVKVGASLIESYIDFLFGGGYSQTFLEWVPLKSLSFAQMPSDSRALLGALKPVTLEEGNLIIDRRSYIFVGDVTAGQRLCVDLMARGHAHILALVRRYETGKPPLPDGVDETSLKNLCCRWFWAGRLRRVAQRVCSMSNVVSGGEKFAQKQGKSVPMVGIRSDSIDGEVERVDAWILDVVGDDDDEDEPFGTEHKTILRVDIETTDSKKEVAGSIDEVVQQIRAVLPLFTK